MNKLGALSLITGLAIAAVGGMAIASSDSGEMPAQGTAMTGKPGMTREGMMIPPMDPAKGRKLFASKGCVVCHSINGIGGVDAPPLDASTMPAIMNPFDFAAKMWRGAGTMISMQEDELGEQIEFSGDELANIIAFVHSADEQAKFSGADIPPAISQLMDHLGEENDENDNSETME